VLLLGRLGVVEEAHQQLRMPDVQLLLATGLDQVRSALARAGIGHLVMGVGLDLVRGDRNIVARLRRNACDATRVLRLLGITSLRGRSFTACPAGPGGGVSEMAVANGSAAVVSFASQASGPGPGWSG
jgi:hypothetical protein